MPYSWWVFGEQAAATLRRVHSEIFGDERPPSIEPARRMQFDIASAIEQRMRVIAAQVQLAVARDLEPVEQAIAQIAQWMDDRAIVRVLGAGRARLAASIPANRMAHGGARIYLQDDMVPMPHSLHGGGILAASASGRTPSVLGALSQARTRNRDIRVVGIASAEAEEFASLCDVFIGMPAVDSPIQLRALADVEEHAICELLDCLVVEAGRRSGFTDATWRLGHEDLGPATGPYDFHLTQ